MELKDRPYKILCVNCRKTLYLFYGKFQGRFNYADFRPYSRDIPPPSPKEQMVCPYCSKAWYLLQVTGGLLVMTDRGWKPREPEGPKEVIVAEPRLGISLPTGDFVDPKGG